MHMSMLACFCTDRKCMIGDLHDFNKSSAPYPGTSDNGALCLLFQTMVKE